MSSHSHPASYRAAVLTKKGGPFEIVEVPWKDPKPNEVVVKTLANGVCHSDSTVVDQDVSSGHTRTPGHEIVGEVVAIGKEVTKWKLGMRVGSGWHGGHCFQCRSCRAGDFVTCYNENINGIISDGGYAEYVTLREEAVLSVPEDIDPAEASPMLCAGVTTFNALRHMDVHPGEIVAIQGIGGLGHLAIQFSRAMGFKTVALSNSGAKAALAKELGAHEYIDGSKVDQAEALQKMGGAKVVLGLAPSGKAMEALIPGLAPNGQLCLEDTIKFAKENGIKCKIERYKLDQVNEAYQSMISGKARFRAVLVF
ncbi:GroES-like protein [Pseudohyphozyma bogoriensis]|nr:GroES-like protein [Pseudohyphozyma bogoriensis]